jgi:hypothetical protein
MGGAPGPQPAVLRGTRLVAIIAGETPGAAVCPYFRPADRNAWNAACASGDLSAALKACISAAI